MILYYILVPFAWLLWHIGFRIHVEGRENLKKVQTKGCILAPTHVSAIDPVFIVVTRWGRRMIVFAKKELFEINALLTWFFRCCGGVCVRGTKDEMAVISQTVEACKQGKTLLIFPEGTRYKGEEGGAGEFKQGAFRIAVKTGAPVVPVAITGARALFENNGNLCHPGTVRIKVLPPIQTAGMSRAEQKQLPDAVRQSILAALK